MSGASRSSSWTGSGSGSTTSGSGRPRGSRAGGATRSSELPPAGGLQLERIDFAPDDRRAALFGLRMTNPGPGSRTVTVKVDAHSELMTEYPWGFSTVPNAAGNRPDTARFDDGALIFRDGDFAAMVASPNDPVAGETGASPNEYRGPQGSTSARPRSRRVLATTGRSARARAASCATRSRCGAAQPRRSGSRWPARTRGYRRPGASCAPRWRPGGAARGQDRRPRALGPLDPALAPGRQAPPGRRRLGQAEHPRPDPGRRGHGDPLDRPGQAVSAARGHRPPGALGRRRLPGLPVDVRHRRRVHGLRERGGRASSSRSRTTCVALRDISDILNDGSGVVAHEVVSDGSIWFGHDSRNRSHDRRAQVQLQHRRDRQVPERGRAGLALDGRQPLPRRRCTTSRSATCATWSSGSTRTATAGRKGGATSSARAWASRSSTTPST